MELFHWKSPAGNFGDDLNLWLWDELLPGWDEVDPGRLLVGVGTVLNTELLPRQEGYLVVGSGFGYGVPPRAARDPAWDIRCVRGPLTARAMGLDGHLALTDPAAMVVRLGQFAGVEHRGGTLFVPHCHSDLDPDYDWPSICAELGMELQSPRAAAQEVIRRIAAADRVITESMHGAIIADAFRVPWQAVSLNDRFSEFKWRDWGLSVGLEHIPITPLPRPVRRARNWLRRARDLAPVGRRADAPGWRATGVPRPPAAGGAEGRGIKGRGVAFLRKLQHRRTVETLGRVARQEPLLSPDGVLDARLDRLEEILAAISRDYGLGLERRAS